MQAVGLFFAIVGFIATIVWFWFAARGLRTLGDIRDELRKRNTE